VLGGCDRKLLGGFACRVLSGFARNMLPQRRPQRAQPIVTQGRPARDVLFGGARGTPDACADRMAARDFQDLLCWQLSYELKCEVFAFTAKSPASRDFKYRDQIRDSAAAAPRDISEGFGRFRPREFARFLEYARASLMETLTSLIDGRDRGYMTPDLSARLLNLGRAALRVTTRLMRSKQRQGAGSVKPSRSPKRSFSISVAELEAHRQRRERATKGKA